MFFICPIFSQIDENYPVETEFLRVFANDSDVGLVTIQFVNSKGWWYFPLCQWYDSDNALESTIIML